MTKRAEIIPFQRSPARPAAGGGEFGAEIIIFPGVRLPPREPKLCEDVFAAADPDALCGCKTVCRCTGRARTFAIDRKAKKRKARKGKGEPLR